MIEGGAPRSGPPSGRGRAFNEWLRAQLKSKKLSQRQLAQQSGVASSTISRLLSGDRMPSLGTATKLARGLRELTETDDRPQYLGLLGSETQNPTARVEYALRADDALSEPQVRQTMEYYLAVRMRRLGQRPAGAGSPASSAPAQPFPKFERLAEPMRHSLANAWDQAQRARLVDVYGLERYLAEVGEVIHTDSDLAGRARRLWQAPRMRDIAIVVVEVTNSSPEPDGTYRQFWLRVPPNIRTCQAAVAWTFGLEAGDYAPEAES